MGLFDCVMFSLSNALKWKPGASGASARKILFMDRLDRRTLEVAVQDTQRSAQQGEKVAESAH